ncbi:MAG: hypothetical protein QXK12_03720 [Candidatus Nezhaarchaeales archaeon]
MRRKVWGLPRLEEVLIDLIRRRGGTVKDSEVYKMLRTMISDLTFKEFLSTLMKLELHGVVRVSRIMKDVKSITLITKT